MSGELDVKVNKRSGSGRSSRSKSSSFRTSSKGAKTSGTADNSEEESLASSSRSARGKVESSSSSKGNISAPTNTSNLSLHHQNNQNPSQSQNKTLSSSSLAAAVPSDVGGSTSSISSRLSLKNLGKKKSPVRTTQFNLPTTTAAPSISTATGTDQIPEDSISGISNTSSVLARGTNSYLSNNNTSGNKNSGGGESVDVGGQTSSRGLLIKKDRGSSSASPPLQRAYQQQQQQQSSPPSAQKASSLGALTTAPSTNPTPAISATVKTEPADPSIPWIPGTSAPISVDRAHSVKITRKILQNWRSACGRTKDNFIRRWKTLPENHPDFEQCPSSPSTSKKKGCSTSNLNNNNSCNSPATPKKKLDKSAKAGGETSASVKSGGVGAGPSITVNSTTTKSTTTSTVVTSVIKNEPNREPSTVKRTDSTATATTGSTANKPVTSSELQSSSSGVLCANNKLIVGQQQRTTVENEMPVVGIGKGSLSSTGGGVADGVGASSSGINTNTHTGIGGGGMLGGRLGGGLGRPSISVNSSSSGALNGRTGVGGDGPSAIGGASGGQQKPTGWSTYVWTTYVQRHDLEEGLEMEEPKKPDRDFLSEFQKVKLTHFFRHVLDMNHDDVISAEDFVALNQRIRHYIEWSSECIEFHILKEVHSGFLECFLNQPLDGCSGMYYCNSDRETRQHVNIDEWLDVWGGLLRSARTMESLPLWLQYFPKILFQVINKSGSGTISREELRAFYTMFLGIDFRVVNETLESIHKAMTDGGRHKITYDLFKLCFANFLLGKFPNGPGHFLFGICQPQTLERSFPIDYSALNTDPSDLEPYNPETDKNQKAMIIASPSSQSSRSSR